VVWFTGHRDFGFFLRNGMEKVTGIGGLFFRARDPSALGR